MNIKKYSASCVYAERKLNIILKLYKFFKKQIYYAHLHNYDANKVK